MTFFGFGLFLLYSTEDYCPEEVFLKQTEKYFRFDLQMIKQTRKHMAQSHLILRGRGIKNTALFCVSCVAVIGEGYLVPRPSVHSSRNW